MENKKAVAKTRFLKISQRKTLGTCNLVRNLQVDVAKSVLMRTPNKASGFILKTLESAISNAKNKNMDSKKLYISKVAADMGPSYKRSIPWSKGNALPIRKRTIHLVVELEERAEAKKGVNGKADQDDFLKKKDSDNVKTKEENKKEPKAKATPKKEKPSKTRPGLKESKE